MVRPDAYHVITAISPLLFLSIHHCEHYKSGMELSTAAGDAIWCVLKLEYCAIHLPCTLPAMYAVTELTYVNFDRLVERLQLGACASLRAMPQAHA
jgi:hypothetical protein